MRGLLSRFLYSPHRHARRLTFVSVGPGTSLQRGCRFVFQTGSGGFGGQVRIGSDSVLFCEFVFESDQGRIEIGDRCYINSGTRLISRESITIGSDVTIAWGCTFYDHNSHSLDWRQRKQDHARLLRNLRSGLPLVHDKNWGSVKARPIVVEDHCWVGFGVTVLNGVRLGEGCIVAAGSVVREDVAPWTVVAGNPAVFVRSLDPKQAPRALE